ncbi:MAG: metallophosphoesterase [Planctomycetota bacterium]
MKVFAISDLHLPGGQDKPMHVFGEQWRDHPMKIGRAWRERIDPDDLVLVGGDLTWAMRLPEALPDIDYLERLPGRKVLIKGNHDYWWTTDAKVRAVLPGSLTILNGHAIRIGDLAIAGTRGWSLPSTPEFSEQDARIYQRELGRLERALVEMTALAAPHRLALIHYPPASQDDPASELALLLEKFQVPTCVYGHLHGVAEHERAIKGDHRGVFYHLTACDYLDFAPVEIPLR